MKQPKPKSTFVSEAVAAGRKRRHDEYVEAIRTGTYTRSWTVPNGKRYRRTVGKRVEA